MTDTTTEAPQSPVRFDIIDAQIAWAEAEEAKGAMSAWRQGDWLTDDAPCGTAYCIAGHIAYDAGYRQVNVNSLKMVNIETGHKDWPWDIATRALGHADVMDRAFDQEHERVRQLIASGESGLSYPDGGAYYRCTDIFDATNTIAGLKWIRDTYARLEGVPTKYDAEVTA